MSEISTTATPAVRRRPRQRIAEIRLPGGDVLVPRASFAKEIGVCEKTALRWDLPATTIGGVAYIQKTAALQVIAASVHRRNQPAARSNPRKRRI